MLEIKNIKVCYGEVLAVADVSLKVPRGKIVALVGGNGNGKSTTLRAVAGLNPLRNGTISFEGKQIQSLPAQRRVPLGISLVPEGRRLFPRLTVRRNLELGAYLEDDARRVEEGIEEMFRQFPILKEREKQLAGTMSGGEQQMLAIGRGLMARPRLLMLDEPSWGIAPKFVARMLEVVQQVNASGVSVLLVEQNLQKALAIADTGYVIQTGRIVMEGKASDLLHDERIKKAYLGL